MLTEAPRCGAREGHAGSSAPSLDLLHVLKGMDGRVTGQERRSCLVQSHARPAARIPLPLPLPLPPSLRNGLSPSEPPPRLSLLLPLTPTFPFLLFRSPPSSLSRARSLPHARAVSL
eukprot:6174696-Pleurochrysis_carterae.AAC.2